MHHLEDGPRDIHNVFFVSFSSHLGGTLSAFMTARVLICMVDHLNEH
jgi:hypothetical protein